MYGRQAGSNQGQQMLRRHGNLTPYATLLQWNVCWGLCMLTVHYHHYHPGCLRSHQSNQPWSSKRKYSVLYTSGICWTIYNNTQIHAKRLSSWADPIMCPAKLLPMWIFGERRLCIDGFYLWWWKIHNLFWKHYYHKGNEDEIKNETLQKTICGGDNISD